MALTYLKYVNYFAMLLGYIIIFIVLFLILLSAIFLLKDKYKNWKAKKVRDKSQKQEEKRKNMEQQKESEKMPQEVNVEASLKQ